MQWNAKGIFIIDCITMTQPFKGIGFCDRKVNLHFGFKTPHIK